MALPRIEAALLENNQTPEGIRIPKSTDSFTLVLRLSINSKPLLTTSFIGQHSTIIVDLLADFYFIIIFAENTYMKITLIQDTIHWANKTANLKKNRKQLAELAGKQIWSFSLKCSLQVLHRPIGITLKPWKVKQFSPCKSGHKPIIWPLLEVLSLTKMIVFNRGFCFPRWKIETADKRHLFFDRRRGSAFQRRFQKAHYQLLWIQISDYWFCYDVRFRFGRAT